MRTTSSRIADAMLFRRVLFGLALLLACVPAPVLQPAWDGKPREQRRDAPLVETTRARDDVDPQLAEEMHARLDELALIVPYVVRGDVRQARALGDELLGRLGEAGPVDWATDLAALRIDVRALTKAEDLRAAADATARIAAGCGECHDHLGVVPPFEDEPMPEGPLDEHMRMKLHAWGMARLREGLVGPSPERWLQGTATFAALPGCRQADARRELCTRVEVLAHRAHVVDAREARIRLYGELLGTCAGCHAR